MQDFSQLLPVGLHNPKVKQYLAIKNNEQPTGEHLVCIEGLRMLTRALDAGVELSSFFVCPTRLKGDEGRMLAQRLLEMGVPTYAVSAKVFGHFVEWDGPDGLAALAHLPRFGWDKLKPASHSALLVLDGLQTPGNIGTIIRSADGAGAAGVLVTNSKVRLSHPRIIHASIGSMFAFPVLETSSGEAIGWLKHYGFSIVTTDTRAALSYRQSDYRGRVAIVMGNERHGISPEWYAAQDRSVSIPMHGRGDSLNVSNAAVLMLYEVMHQQKMQYL